jgi:hypothetical protein
MKHHVSTWSLDHFIIVLNNYLGECVSEAHKNMFIASIAALLVQA